jgi:hypothetical protein
MNQEIIVPVNKLEAEAIAISARAYRVPRFMTPRLGFPGRPGRSTRPHAFNNVERRLRNSAALAYRLLSF